MPGNEIEQVSAIHDQGFRLIGGYGGGGAGAAIEQRDFAKDVSGEILRENDGLARAIFHEHLHGAAAHNVESFAGVAIVKDGLTLAEAAHIKQAGQGGALTIIKQLK